MLMFLFWIQKNKLRIIIKLNNQASPHLDPIEKVTTKLLKAWKVELNQATKIITINPKDIQITKDKAVVLSSSIIKEVADIEEMMK